jgi:simple sugar transport system permease protein
MSLSRASALRLLSKSKLFWGVTAILLSGYWFSPRDAHGDSIFLTSANLGDVLRQVSITGLVAIGMTLVILTGGIDLSVGSMMGLAATLAAMLVTKTGLSRAAGFSGPAVGCALAGTLWLILASRIRHGFQSTTAIKVAAALVALVAAVAIAVATHWQVARGPTLPVDVLVVLCVGVAIGAVNGVVVATGGLQPFIVTLAMMVAALGAARLLAGEDQSVYPIYAGQNAPISVDAFRQYYLGLPLPGLIFLGVALIFSLLLAYFRFGREIYAVGGNERAAHLAGIDVARVKLLAYAISGGLGALAGLLYAAQYRQGKPDAGTGLELDAIAAVVIGGASLMGGKGTIIGTVIGVAIFGLITNIFQLCDVDSSMQLVLKGVIIVVAVLLQEGRMPRLRFRRQS